jgi:hypothetical protein
MSPSEPPRRYLEYGEALQAFEERAKKSRIEQEGDIAFALENGAIVIEGPWDDLPAQKVAYVGVDITGRREALAAINSNWRFSPVGKPIVTDSGAGEMKVVLRDLPDVIAIRIPLGRSMPGMVVGRAHGRAPVQSYGVIDGRDYYFRSRGEHWSMSIGASASKPDWYYEERYGTWPEAGSISDDQVYNFIAEAASKFRAGAPTAAERTIDRGTASILAAIGALPPDSKVG